MTYNKLYKEYIKLMKINKISRKKLNDVEHEKESLVIKLSKSYALVDSLKLMSAKYRIFGPLNSHLLNL
jgi:hypothetical protein